MNGDKQNKQSATKINVSSRINKLRSFSSSYSKMPSNPTIKRIQYGRDTLREAMSAIKGGMPVLKASHKFKVPRTTLHNKLRSNNIDKKPGPETCLTPSEEEKLAQWVLDCSNIGMPIGRQQIQNSVPFLFKSTSRAAGKQCTNGKKWYKNFLQRHQQIVDTIINNSAIARAGATEAGIKSWFASVGQYLEERMLINIDPSRVFSSEILLLSNPEKKNDRRTGLYVQMTGNAAGHLMSPLIAFTEEKIEKVCEEMPEGWLVAKSGSGTVTAENFYGYVKDSFHPWLVANNIEFPVVLLLDGKVQYLTLALTDFCKEHYIELIALHPNSSIVMHPLESLFAPLRREWKTMLEEYKERESVNFPVEATASCLKSTIDQLDVSNLLRAGFESTGLHPFSVNCINLKTLQRKTADRVPKDKGSNLSDKPANEQVEQVPMTADEQFLEQLEQKIDPNTLQAFKDVPNSEEWTGSKEDTAMFYFWRDAVNRASFTMNTDTECPYDFPENPVDLCDMVFYNDNFEVIQYENQCENVVETSDQTENDKTVANN